MERAKFNYISSLLYDYPKTDSYIKEREQELTYPYHPDVDENIGGGRTSRIDNPAERLALNIATDRRLTAIERNKRIIDESMDESDPFTCKIIEEVYFKKARSIEGLTADIDMPLSYSQAKRRRTEFFELIAEKLGL